MSPTHGGMNIEVRENSARIPERDKILRSLKKHERMYL